MHKIELNRYLNTEEIFFKNLNQSLVENLSLYCTTGSLARKDVIPGWTDIDILLAVDELNLEVFEKISETLAKNESGIKIGLSIFTTKEMSRTDQKLARTMLAMNEIMGGTLIPRIMKEHVRLAKATEEQILETSRVEYARALHDYKRSIMDCDPVNEAKTYKLLILMMKILLREKGVAVKSYSEVLEHLIALYPNLAIQSPQVIMQTPSLFPQRKAQYADLVHYLAGFPA